MSGPAVLDVGCGDGAMLPHLLKAGAEQGQYLGIDIASTMIDRAEMAHPKAMFKRAEFLNLEPMSEAYDGVLLNGVSQFFEDDLVLIAQATKWLKPGGPGGSPTGAAGSLPGPDSVARCHRAPAAHAETGRTVRAGRTGSQ